LTYRFGDKKSTPAQSAQRPTEEPSTTPQATADYCTMLDIQFEINRDEIQREELERLGVVSTFLKKYPQTKAVIEGHTDNVGSAMSNQILSRHRAESVLNYLVDNQRIARSRLSAVGYGDTRPIASNNNEAGKRMNRRINTVIPCAQDIVGLNPEAARVTMGMLIEFDLNSSEIKPEYHAELAKVGTFLEQNKMVTATVEGHTANLQTTPALAQEISQRRAQNVVDYLADNAGVQRSRLTAQGFGQSRQYSYNTNAAGRQENRRVNIIFSYPQQ
jgi:OOP family OmpA-OmpF porin